MRRPRLPIVCLAVLCAHALAACGSKSTEDTTFHNTDVTGTWDVYRTYAGEPERGPDAATFTNVASGYGVGVRFECSAHVLPAGHVNLAGELRGTALTLAADNASWVGTVAGATMDGELADSIGGSGTWRAVKVPAARCKTYEVWGGFTDLSCSTYTYEPQAHGYALLGSGTGTGTFEGSYLYYLVVTRDANQVQVDAVEPVPGTLLPVVCTGNLSSTPGTLASVDGAGYVVGNGSMSGGGYLRFDPWPTPTSIRVYIVP